MFQEALENNEGPIRDENDRATAIEMATTDFLVNSARFLAAQPSKYPPRESNGKWLCYNCDGELAVAKPFCDCECSKEYEDFLKGARYG